MVQSGIATAKFHNVIDLVKVMEKPMNSLGYEAAGVDVEILGNIQQSCHHKTIMIMMNRTVLPPPPPTSLPPLSLSLSLSVLLFLLPGLSMLWMCVVWPLVGRDTNKKRN